VKIALACWWELVVFLLLLSSLTIATRIRAGDTVSAPPIFIDAQ